MKFNKPKFWDYKKISIWSILLFPVSIIFLFVSLIVRIFKSLVLRKNYKIPIPQNLYHLLKKIFKNNFSYIGIAPGAGEVNKIWPSENFIEVGKFFQTKSNKSCLILRFLNYSLMTGPTTFL